VAADCCVGAICAPDRMEGPVSAKCSTIDLTIAGRLPAAAALGLLGTLLLIGP